MILASTFETIDVIELLVLFAIPIILIVFSCDRSASRARRARSKNRKPASRSCTLVHCFIAQTD